MRALVTMNRSFILYICLVLLSVGLWQCGGMGGGSVATYPGQVTPEIQAEFNRVDEQYRRQSYDYAFSGYQHFIQTYPYNELTDEAYYKQGKIYFVSKRYQEAVTKLNELSRQTPSALYRAKAFHMAGYAYFKMGQYAEALETFEKVNGEVLPTKLRIQYYSLVLQAGKMSQASEDFVALTKLKLFSLYEDVASQSMRNLSGGNVIPYAQVRLMVEAWIDEPMKSSAIPVWMRKFPQDSPAYAYVLFKLGKVYYEENSKKARKPLSRFLSMYPKNIYASTAGKWLQELGGATESDVALKKANYKVGVLLPLTGRYESYGMSVLDGVKCAAGQNNACGGESGVQLVIKEAHFTPGAVRASIEELAKENVVAIIGPLTGKLSIEAGIAATEKNIPIFPITQKSGLMSQGDHIFQIGMPPKMQVEALVQAAWGRGHKNYGVFFPDNNYGKTMSELFIEEIQNRGGRITAKAMYKKRSPDFLGEARKLKRSIGRVGRAGKGVGFDALFIPDSFQSINAIVGGLEFNGIKDVALLGTNAWNDPGLTLAIADQFPGSFFIDLYDGTSKDKKVAEFNEKFAASFGRHPRVLEAYGYDILMMIRTVASSKGPSRIKNALVNHMGYSGVTGIKGFKVGEGPVFESMVLRIREKGVTE